MGEWANFAVIAGGASATLTGLLFVAASIRLVSPTTPRDVRLRAAQTLTLFTTVVVLCTLVVIPGQVHLVLGLEFLLGWAVLVAVLLYLDWQADRDVSSPAFTRSLRRSSPNLAAPTLVGISGLLLALGHEWGLYLAAVGIVLVLITGVTNSWLFLLRPDQAEKRGS